MTASRIADDTVSLIYMHDTDNGDGSATVVYETIQRNASVGILQPRDIERLEKGGIIIRNGVTIVISEAPAKKPDTISHGHTSYRVVQWSVVNEYDVYDEYDEYTERRGVIVATCDEIPLPAANA